ncbi:hypothetical protein ACROYT_G044193 [Oculina patagonica]
MAHPMATSLKSRALSRRDHVLNLLPPLTVVNKEDVTMHDRLFSDNPPAKNYPENFPSKVLRHLGAWTFYSAPTKGELALLDKSMYDLEKEANDPDKSNAKEKKNSGHIENMTEQGTAVHHKHTPRTQSHYADNDKKRLETRKEKTPKVDKEMPVQQTREDEKILQKETSKEIVQQKPQSTPESTQRKSSVKTKQVRRKKGNDIETTKTTKRRSYITRAPKKLQKNAQVKRTNSQTPVANVEITLKRSRGKVLGGAETGDEIGTEPLTVEGHNVSVPGHDRSHGQSYRQTQDTGRGGGHNETIKFNTTERERQQNNDSSDEVDNNNKAVTPLVTPHAGNRAVTPLVTPHADNRAVTPRVTPHTDDIKSQSKADPPGSQSQDKVDSLESEEQCENAVKPEVSSKDPSSNLENDLLRDKRVTFSASSEKEPANEKKRAKSQNGRKRERKRSGKNRVKSG